MSHCYFCEQENVETQRVDNRPVFEVDCPECGNYSISDVLTSLGLSEDQKRAAIWYLTNNENFEFTGENIGLIEQEYRVFLQLRRE
jgi:hypothetical protein